MLCQAMELLMHACMAFGQLDYLASCSGCCVDIMIIIQLLRCQLDTLDVAHLRLLDWTGLGPHYYLEWSGRFRRSFDSFLCVVYYYLLLIIKYCMAAQLTDDNNISLSIL